MILKSLEHWFRTQITSFKSREDTFEGGSYPYPEVIYPDDRFVVSYPRSGNLWLRSLIFIMQNPSLEPNKNKVNAHFPDIYKAKDRLSDLPRPRIMKSHELYRPDYLRTIYLVRDGRDVAVSYFNFHQTIHGYSGSFEEFLKIFLNGEKMRYGSWQNHVKQWILLSETTPPITIKYEQIYNEPYTTLQIVADFLKMDVTDERIQCAVQKCTFEARKKDVMENNPNYERGYTGGVKGSPGAWHEYFSQEMLGEFLNMAGPVMQMIGYL